MMRIGPLVIALSSVALAVPQLWAQGLPPLGPAPQQPAGLPPLPGTSAGSVTGLSADKANADLKLARTANQEKRYEDAENLMLKDTAARPTMLPLWVELGNAQLGLKKYEDAETSYKAAVTEGEAAQKAPPAGGFYSADNRTVAHVAVSTAQGDAKAGDLHEIHGAAYAGLGEVYIRLNKIPEAKDAWDKAVAAYPAQAPLYLRNETILFLQTGHAVEQVEAANKAIAVDPTRAALYFFKGQGLAAQSTIDPKTQKLVLPAGCAEALEKYLDLEPAGQYAADAKGMLAAAGVAIKGKK